MIMDAFENLGNAVVLQAARDYQEALVRQEDYVLWPETDEYRVWTGKVQELEKFFDGDGIKSYTRLNGTALKNRLKEEVIKYSYNLDAIRKAHKLNREEGP